MSLRVRPFCESDAETWDQFCALGLQATLLHTRRFLSYHGTRFTDASLIIETEQGKCLGVFPAALQPDDHSIVTSHPGSTYGGIVHQGRLSGESMLLAMAKICLFYQEKGLALLRYKAVPMFYHQQAAQDDSYALFRLGARRYRCDLSSSIDLERRLAVSERRRRGLKKAQKNAISISREMHHLASLWEILTENLHRKHGVKPVHTLAEISLLVDRFPQQIRLTVALKDGMVIAGVLLFIAPTCYHTQYIAASEDGYHFSALDAVFDDCIEQAKEAGARWLDFGICNEQNGQVLNENLFRFKTEFGGGGTVHEFFEIALSSPDQTSLFAEIVTSSSSDA